jgi:hypothetical protein
LTGLAAYAKIHTYNKQLIENIMTIFIVCYDASEYYDYLGDCTWEYRETFKTRKEAKAYIKSEAFDYSGSEWKDSAMYNFDEAKECWKIIEKTL